MYASSVNAPAEDLDGRPRPVDLEGHGTGFTTQEYDIGAYEARSVILLPTRVDPAHWMLYE